MKPETVIIIRKLAGEATIFALLGVVVTAIGVSVAIERGDRANAKRQAAIAVHADIDWNAQNSQPTPTVEVPLRNGTVLHVRQCPAPPPGLLPLPGEDCVNFSEDYYDKPPAKQAGGYLSAVPLGNADQIAIEKDYWTAYREARHHDLVGQMWGTMLVGSLGFPAGLGLWIFYRLVRFAVKG